MFSSSISKDWSVSKPSTEFGEKTRQHAALVSGAFLVELATVLCEGMDEKRAKKHYIQPAYESFNNLYYRDSGINPYTARFRLTPSMVVLAQKDIEQKINRNDPESETDIKTLKAICAKLQEARDCVGPVYETKNVPHADGMDAATFFYLHGKISGEEAAEMADRIDARRHEM